MEKLSIQEFQEIKDRMQEIYDEIMIYYNPDTEEFDIDEKDITEEEKAAIGERFKKIEQDVSDFAERMKAHDLSGIPYESWSGFKWFDQIDFEGTGANIDFNLFEPANLYGMIKVKGCNVRNFDFSNGHYNEDSFSKEFVEEHIEHFGATHIEDPEAKERYYSGNLKIADIVRYGLDVRDISKLSFADKVIVKKYGFDTAMKIDLSILDNLTYTMSEWIKNGSLGTAQETLTINPEELSEEPDINELILERIKYDIVKSGSSYKYEYYYNTPYVRENLSKYMIDFSINPDAAEGRIVDWRRDNVLSSFKGKRLTINDVMKGYEIFKGKEYAYALNVNANGITITEDIIDSFYREYEGLASAVRSLGISTDDMVIDYYRYLQNGEKEQFLEKIKEDIKSAYYYQKKEMKISDVAKISQYYPKLKEFDFPSISFLQELIEKQPLEMLTKVDDVSLIDLEEKDLEKVKSIGERIGTYGFAKKTTQIIEEKFGIDTAIQINKETNGVLQELLNIDQKEIISILEKEDDERFRVPENASYEDYEKMFVELIKEIKDRSLFDYSKARGAFSERYPEIFLPEDAPVDLTKKYYKKEIKINDLIHYPKWEEILLDKDLANGMKEVSIKAVNEDGLYVDIDLVRFLEENQSKEEVFKFLKDYVVFLENPSRIYQSSIIIKGKNALRQDMSITEIRDVFESEFYDMIRTNNLPYSDSLPKSFKDKYPELFFSDKIPGDVRERIYSGKIELEDIRAVDGLYEELLEKDDKVIFTKFDYQNPGMLNVKKYIGKENFLALAKKYGYYFQKASIPVTEIMEKSLEEMEDIVEKHILTGISDGKISYGPDAPSFIKEAHPEWFISDDAPELLKLSFYSKYVSNHPEYENHSSSNYRISFKNYAEHPEWIDFLRGKDTDRFAYYKEKRIYEKFGFDKIVEFANIDVDALQYIVDSNVIDTFFEFYNEKSEYFAWKEMKDVEKIPQEVSAPAVLGTEPETPEQIEAKKMFDKKVEKFKLEIFRNPGVFIHYPREKIGEFNFGEYRDLKNSSNFSANTDYRRGMEEKIISHMYAFLGYGEAKKMLQLPNLTREDIERIYTEQQASFEAVYEKRFKLKGNIKVLNTFFEKFEPILPGGKTKFQVYKAINQRLEAGYEGNLYDLLEECIQSAGIKVDKEKLKLCTDNTESVQVSEKMHFVKEKMMQKINEYVEENPADKKILYDNFFAAMKESLQHYKKIDRESIEVFLQKEFSRLKEDGTTFYSPHVTEHLPEILRIVDEFNNTPEIANVMNKNEVGLLKEEKEKIGMGWIRRALEISDNLTLPELEALEQKIYGDSGKEIDFEKHVVLKNNTEKGRIEAYELLKKDSNPMLLTYAKAEKMFDSLTGPYSEKFAEYFIKHKEEFMAEPKFYTILKKMNDTYDEIMNKPHNRNRAATGRITVSELERMVNDVKFPGTKTGEYELEYAAIIGRLNPMYYDVAKRLYAEMKERTHQTIPQMEISRGRFRGRILRIDDPLHLVVGNITDCCQAIGQHAGEGSMIHSATEKNGSVFVVEEYDEYGNYVNTVAQSWTWRNGDRICFDNVEIPDGLEDEFVRNGTHEEIFEIYKEAGKLILENDKKALKAMLDSGKITEEQYGILVVKDVTMGTGCDDLVKHLSSKTKDTLKRANIVSPLEENKGYDGVQKNKTPWIDSKHTQYIVASMDSDERKTLKSNGKASLEDIPFQYTRTREVISRKGNGIHYDILAAMREMKQREGDTESFVAKKEIEEVEEIVYSESSVENRDQVCLSMNTNEDWFILSTKTDNRIKVLDTCITSGKLGSEAQKEHDEALAVMEYNQSMQKLILEANDTNKKLICTIGEEAKYDIFRKLQEANIISVSEDGEINLVSRDSLIQRIDSDRDKIEKGLFARNLADTVKPESTENGKKEDDYER